MNQREIQKENTRSLLLKTAKQMFAENGLINAKTLAIAKKAGLSHGTLFSHFKTREELLETVIESFGLGVAGQINILVNQNSNLEDILRCHIKSIKDNEIFYIRLISEAAMLPPKANESLLAIQSVISHHINRAAAIEIKEKRIKNIEPYLIFNTWIGLLHHYLLNKKMFSPKGSVMDRYGENLITHYLDLLKL